MKTKFKTVICHFYCTINGQNMLKSPVCYYVHSHMPCLSMYQYCNVHLTLGVRRPHAQSDSCQQLCSFVFDIRPDSSCKAVYPRGPCMYYSTVTRPIVVVPPCTATYLFTDAPRPVSAHVKWLLLARRWNGQTGVKSVCRLLWKSLSRGSVMVY